MVVKRYSPAVEAAQTKTTSRLRKPDLYTIVTYNNNVSEWLTRSDLQRLATKKWADAKITKLVEKRDEKQAKLTQALEKKNSSPGYRKASY